MLRPRPTLSSSRCARCLQDDGRRVLDANDVVDAVAYIFHLADELGRPCVINLSLNTMSGPHDGDGHFERRLADLLSSGGAGSDIKGRAVVVAAGNLPKTSAQWRQWPHIADSVSPGQPFEFFWNLRYTRRDKTRNTLEIWYDAQDAWLQVTLSNATAGFEATVAPGQAAEIFAGRNVIGSVIGSRVRPQILDNPEVRHHQRVPLPNGDHVAGRHVILLSLILIPKETPIGRYRSPWSTLPTSRSQAPHRSHSTPGSSATMKDQRGS